MSDPSLSRRKFMRNSSCGLMSSIPALNSIFNMTLGSNLAQAVAPGEEDDYKALVCLFLNGGNDSFNMLVPTTPSEYFWYELTRSSVSLADTSLHALTTLNTPGRTFGVHPALPDVATLFNQGNASFVANVGTLTEPIPDVAAYESGVHSIPVSLGAHNTAQTHWETGLPQYVTNSTGWLGRTADILNAQNNASTIPMGFGLTNKKIVNQGVSNSGLAIGANGIELLDNVNFKDQWLKTRFEAQRSRAYQNIMQRVHQEKVTEYSDLANSFQASFDTTSTTNVFSGGLSANFEAIARTISLRDDFCVKRQTFFISFGNWDGHANLLTNQDLLLAEVNTALKEFWDEMVSQGLEDKVTVFTGSDFGRTLRSNGNGTDHAWGGNALVMGGALNGGATTGGKILGSYPQELKLGEGLDTGSNGRLLPTTSIDSYYADLLLWLGVPPSDLPQALPNIGEFYDINSASPPLGLFTA